jgi:hypothetical protein
LDNPVDVLECETDGVAVTERVQLKALIAGQNPAFRIRCAHPAGDTCELQHALVRLKYLPNLDGRIDPDAVDTRPFVDLREGAYARAGQRMTWPIHVELLIAELVVEGPYW